MKPVVREETTGCAIASAVAIAGVTFSEVKKIANSMGIYAEDTKLCLETAQIRNVLKKLGVECASKETVFQNWESLPDVTRFKMGDAVFGMTNHFFSEVLGSFAVFKETEVAKAPVAIPLVDAASISLAAQTALQALRDLSDVDQDKKNLITGAGGGVGHFAVQIARILG